MILWTLCVLLGTSCFAQIVHNGDFENGEKDPWLCRGCQGHVWAPGHNSLNSFYADHRTESWNGPAQFLNTAEVDALDSLKVTFNFSLMSDEDVSVLWKLMCKDENGKHTETLYEGTFIANQWKSVSEEMTLPDFARGASQIDLYMEGFPGTVSWRIDDISMDSGNVETTMSPSTSPEPSTTTTSSDCSNVFTLESEEDDSWHGLITVAVMEDTTEWEIVLEFDHNVDSIQSPLGDVSGSGKSWVIDNKSFDGELDEGEVFELRFEAYFSGRSPNVIKISFNDADLCDEDDTTPTAPPDGDCADTVIIETEEDGKWHGLIVFMPTEDMEQWRMEIGFSQNVDSLESPLGSVTGSGKNWVVMSKSFDQELTAGIPLEFRFEVYYSGSKPVASRIVFNEESLCN